MSNSNQVSLRAALSADYEGLARRLARCLGSKDLAREALHETFIKVERISDVTPIHSPSDFLFRTAINVAKDRRKSDGRLLSALEIDAILDVPEDSPDPSQVIEGRLAMQELEKALTELPTRQRDVFLAAHVEQIPHREIAQRFSINERTVAFDLQHAMEHLSCRLARKSVRRFGPRKKEALR